MLLAAPPGAVDAAPVTLTGADLLTYSSASFPGTPPVVSGSSLIFESGLSSERLLVLPLVQPTPATESVHVTVSLNLTRLACSGACAGGAADFDPLLLLGDGYSYLGGVPADEGVGGFITCVASGNTVQRGEDVVLFWGAGYPGIGESFDITLDWYLQGSGV